MGSPEEAQREIEAVTDEVEPMPYAAGYPFGIGPSTCLLCPKESEACDPGIHREYGGKERRYNELQASSRHGVGYPYGHQIEPDPDCRFCKGDQQ